MKIRKNILLITLCLTLVLPMAVHESRMVYAADEIIIKSPQANDRITDQYQLKYTVSEIIEPKSIQVSYRDAHGAMATMDVTPNSSDSATAPYVTLIQGLAQGENIITVTCVSRDGRRYLNQRRVIVDYKLTNIHSDEENVKPYVTNLNQFKNLLKINNTSAVQNTKNLPKDNAFISRFVEMVFEEAEKENIRPDIVFSQIMLETGWLTYQYDVRETQNNFGGLGATGGGRRGNVFSSTREGIRASVQHLLAYGSTRALKGILVDPRFKYVKRGSAPALEYLGIQENVQGGGWAAGFQYGYKVGNIIERLSNAPVTAFSSQARVAAITEMEVSSILRNSNSLDINLTPGYKVNGELRLAVATNSDTEHRFIILNKRTGTEKTTEWNENKAVFYLPTEAGLYQFQAQIRDRVTKVVSDVKTLEIQIGN